MKLLFDQNLSRHLVGQLRDVFPESEHVTSLGLDAETDQEIWSYAGEHGHVIVSKDSDFRQLAFLHGPTPEGDLVEGRQRFDGDDLPGAPRPSRSDRDVLGQRGRGAARPAAALSRDAASGAVVSPRRSRRTLGRTIPSRANRATAPACAFYGSLAQVGENQTWRQGRRTIVQAVIVRRLVWAMMLVLAACGSDATPAATESDITEPVEEAMLDRATITEQEGAWIAARPAAYAYEVETECECPRVGTFRVIVDGADFLEVEPQDPDAEPYRQYSPPTIDQAFAMLDEPLALAADGEIPTGQASAAFEPTYGYPSSFTIVGSGGLPSYHVEIRDFAPVDPEELDLPPLGLEVIVSNQSYDDPDVDLIITVDGEVMIERSFAVEGQHTYVNYRLPLEPGDHRVAIRSDTGATHDRVVSLGSEPRYLAVSYWGDDSSGSDAISVEESDEPFGTA